MTKAWRNEEMTTPLNLFHEDLLHQQWLQEQHDRTCHADLFGITNTKRLRHYHLHFSKYLAAIYENRERSEEDPKPAIVHALLIALAAANTLNLDLGQRIVTAGEISTKKLSEEAAGMADQEIPTLENLSFWLVDRLLTTLARLAAALEKNEHFEDFDAAGQARQAVIVIARCLIVAAGALRMDIPAEFIARRRRIRENNLFAGLHADLKADPFSQDAGSIRRASPARAGSTCSSIAAG